MKHLCFALILVLFFSSCHKDLASKDEVITAVVASDANSPLKSHKLTFTSDYPVKPGEVPPFSFTKTEYSDARIRTIKMLSRAYPIHPAFPKHAVELIGTFTYAASTEWDKQDYPHLAFLKGTSEVWEYYKTASGAGARRSVSKRTLNLKFKLYPQGYCRRVLEQDFFPPDSAYGEPVNRDWTWLEIDYKEDNPNAIWHLYTNFPTPSGPNGNEITHYFSTLDQYGNMTSLAALQAGTSATHPWYPFHNFAQNPSGVRVTYDYNIPRGSKNYSYIPSQNLISQEYSLLEVMQWVPQETHQRKAGGGTFKANGQWYNQDQVYKNFKFDANGNQTSLTYGDNIAQKTTWHVQP